MQSEQTEGPDELCETCRQMFDGGLIHAAGGNASLRQGDEIFITKTGARLDRLRVDDLVRVALDGQILSSGPPSKEIDLHLATYAVRPAARAVLHPHPPHAIAWSARHARPQLDAVPATNAGFYIRAGQVPRLPYLRSGSAALRESVARLGRDFAAILLGNHGLICAGETLLDALNICEEIEQNCRILLLAGDGARVLSTAERAEIDAVRGRTWPSPDDYQTFFASL